MILFHLPLNLLMLTIWTNAGQLKNMSSNIKACVFSNVVIYSVHGTIFQGSYPAALTTDNVVTVLAVIVGIIHNPILIHGGL